MIGKLLGALSAGFAYFCIATVLALALGYLWLTSSGRLNDERITQLAAIVRGLDPPGFTKEVKPQIDPIADEQPSIEDLARARALASRQIELREEALKNSLEKWRYEFARINNEANRVQQQRGSFEARLRELREKATGGGEQTVRAILENSRPRDAKEQMLAMIENDEMEVVVTLLASMPVGKSKKIAAEFKTPEEVKLLDEIFRMMRQGIPETPLLDEAKAALQPPGENNPAN